MSDAIFKDTSYTYSNFAAVVIPLFYLYFKNLANNNKDFDSKELLHFIFPICFFICIILVNKFLIVSISLEIVFYTIFFVYALCYTVICYQLLKNSIWSRKIESTVNKLPRGRAPEVLEHR
jgi:uncharacterized membrane protein